MKANHHEISMLNTQTDEEDRCPPWTENERCVPLWLPCHCSICLPNGPLLLNTDFPRKYRFIFMNHRPQHDSSNWQFREGKSSIDAIAPEFRSNANPIKDSLTHESHWISTIVSPFGNVIPHSKIITCHFSHIAVIHFRFDDSQKKKKQQPIILFSRWFRECEIHF